MYRITYSQTISDAHSLNREESNISKRRIYRWGTLWGILEGEKWICERRIQLHHTDEYLVESCIPVQCDILPKDVDDCWEEEYIPLSKGLEYTGLVIVKGDAKSVLEIVGIQGLPTPSLPIQSSDSNTIKPIQTTKTSKATNTTNAIHTHQNKVNRNVGKRCMIKD
jgi:hypothetical protein